MAYSAVTFGQLVTELSNRLYDPTNQFWSVAELQQRLSDALRAWNIATAQNQQWYSLSVSNTGNAPWYDLQTLAGSPRLCTLYDTDIYSRLQYMLLESQQADAAVLTSQFTSNMLVQAVQAKRDEFLFRTSTTRTVRNLNVTPNTSTVSLPGTVIQVERAYWMPKQGNTAYPLYRTDQFSRAAFYPTAGQTASSPVVYSSGIEPPLTMEITPPPGVNGTVEALTIETQAALSATSPTLLYLPDDFVPAIAWGALADLLDTNSEASDPQRADYARKRFEMYCELVSGYPFVMGARVNGVDVMVESVEALDIYNPVWRTPVVTQPIVAFAGQNLICYPTTSNVNIAVLVNGSANLPVVSGDYIQLGAEAIDAVLDLAQHEAQFKQGFYETNSTMNLFKNFLNIAAKKNAKIASLSTYKDFIYGNLNVAEKLFAPTEVTSG